MYRGIRKEEQPTNDAIDATDGKVLLYRAACVSTYYRSTSCGRTAALGVIPLRLLRQVGCDRGRMALLAAAPIPRLRPLAGRRPVAAPPVGSVRLRREEDRRRGEGPADTARRNGDDELLGPCADRD